MGFGVFMTFGLVFGNFAYMFAGLFLLLFLLLGVRIGTPRGVRVERRLSKTGAVVGSEVSVDLRVAASGGLGFVVVHDDLPDVVSVTGGSNAHLVHKGLGSRSGQWNYRFRATRRGKYDLAPTRAYGMNPLRLTAAEIVAEGRPQELLVKPRVLQVRRIKNIRARSISFFPAGDIAKTGTTTTDFREIRDYVAGDPLKSVNWKATARHSTPQDLRLLVNEYEVEGRKGVFFLIDSASYMEVGSSLENTFDRTLEATLSLVDFFVGRGFKVGAYVYNAGRPNQERQAHANPEFADPQDEERAGEAHGARKDPQADLLFYPDTGRRQYVRMLSALTGLSPGAGGEGLPWAVERAKGFLLREKPLVVLVTRPEADFDATASGVKRLARYTATTRLRTPILLLAPAIGGTAAKARRDLPKTGPGNRAAPADEATTHAAALLQAKAHAQYRALRRMGVTVIDWDPARVPLSAVMLKGVRQR